MKSITVEITVPSNIETVWDMWTIPQHIEKWNYASGDWECPHAENNVELGGKFSFRMQAKDGTSGFDLSGTYTNVILYKSLSYTLDDGRNVTVSFKEVEGKVHITEIFETEDSNSEDKQRSGWQAILTNFKNYVECH